MRRADENSVPTVAQWMMDRAQPQHCESADSPIETMLRVAVHDLLRITPLPIPVTVTPQWVAGPYRVDVLLSAGAHNVAVECDGHDYHERTKEQAEHDRARDRWFTSQRITLLRFTGAEIHRNPLACAEQAIHELRRLVMPNSKSVARAHLAQMLASLDGTGAP